MGRLHSRSTILGVLALTSLLGACVSEPTGTAWRAGRYDRWPGSRSPRAGPIRRRS